MTSNFVSNVHRRWHHIGSKVTRGLLHGVISNFPPESSNDDTLILPGHIFQTPKKRALCLAFAMAAPCPLASN